jgi:hypothetical protein
MRRLTGRSCCSCPSDWANLKLYDPSNQQVPDECFITFFGEGAGRSLCKVTGFMGSDAMQLFMAFRGGYWRRESGEGSFAPPVLADSQLSFTLKNPCLCGVDYQGLSPRQARGISRE